MRRLMTQTDPMTVNKVAAELLGKDVSGSCPEKVEAIVRYCESYQLTVPDIKAYFPELCDGNTRIH